MTWAWELTSWPNFKYDSSKIAESEKQFLVAVGTSAGFQKSIEKDEYSQLVVEILSTEGLESSRIEGEILDRESLQSSIKRHFGLKPARKERQTEALFAQLLTDVYENFETRLTHEQLWNWHATLFKGHAHIEDKGKYRTHPEPMQIVSNRFGSPRVYFEAPPSRLVKKEMNAFVRWFNQTIAMPVLARAAITHLYFEMIHPFEDGNGRIGRLLVEKTLSQGVKRPVLIAVSKVLEGRKKEYCAALERCNSTLEINNWLEFFASAVIEAQQDSIRLIEFLLVKAKMLAQFSDRINERQEKALVRMFAEGPEGFKGGLSAENYLSITKTSRATATRDLAELVNLGALVKSGELRHTRYRINLQLL